MRSLRFLREITVVAALGMAACEGPEGKPGAAGAPGENGQACEITKNKDGSKTIECIDGTNVTLRDGEDGTPGDDGADGGAGDDGASCTVTDNGDGTKTVSCTDGTEVVVSDGKDGIDTQLTKWEDLPGVVVTIQSVTDSTGGNIQTGDRVSVKFKVATAAGTPIPLNQMSSAGIMLSGPTTNYQRVIARQTDVITRSVANADGSYTYTFATTVPAAYIAPLNDSASFDADDGELKGQPLQSGTYTVGIDAYKTYTVDGASVRDADNATHDVLVGAAASIAAREVVTDGNCNQCHSKLQAHGGSRREVKLCLACHTAGAEDKNVGSAAGGTPGVSIDFGVMVHKIHNAKHLPSVVGLTTDSSGNRVYGAGSALQYVGFGNTPVNLSHIGFPVMPSAYAAFLFDTTGLTYTNSGGNGPMPRDLGYSGLAAANKYKEDMVRTGVVACANCHGDPDGAGPLAAPAQGDLHKSNPTRKACGSCHDDIDWGKPYAANGLSMPAQADDSGCAGCHPASGGQIAVQNGHTHPFDNPVVNAGINVKVLSVGTGSFNAGDVIPITFSVTNATGANISLHTITRFQAMLIGPTENPQVVAPAIQPLDTGFRKSTPFTGNGTAARPTYTAGAVPQTIAVIFDSATAFTVTGTTTTTPANYVIGAAAGSFVDVTFANATFRVTQGATAFAANDRFYIDAWPTAASYTMNLGMDWSFEHLGYALGASAVTLAVANTPMIWGRQVVTELTATGTAGTLREDAGVLDRLVVVDASTLGLAVGDRVVIDAGQPEEEIVQIGRIQTASDYIPFLDLASDDRLYFTTALRYAHDAGASIAKATLTNRREGTDYVVKNPATGEITLLPGRFTAGNSVVVTYRADARFGWKRRASESLRDEYQPAAADSPEIGQAAGDWVGLKMLSGTYTVGLWAHKDFSVTTMGALSGTTRAWNDVSVDDTTYRSIAAPATKNVLFGGATTIKPRAIVSSPANCETCHDKVMWHGNGRMGLDTCMMCHSISGLEDGPKYSYGSWYTPASPGVSMEFRNIMHKVHMGKELPKKDEFEMTGVFLGVPYTATVEDKGFPSMPGGAKDCVKCHGAGNTAWEVPAERSHPDAKTPVRVWTQSCNTCHDSDAALAHMDVQTANGVESCEVCHGQGRELSVKVSHKVR